MSSGCLGCRLTSENFLRSSLANMSLFGLTPVVACSVALCALTPLRTSSLTGLPSNAVIGAVFFILCINLSTSPLAPAHPSVTFRYLNPSSCKYSSNLWLLKGGPLSDLMSFDTPYVLNTLLITGMVAFFLVGIWNIDSRIRGRGLH